MSRMHVYRYMYTCTYGIGRLIYRVAKKVAKACVCGLEPVDICP